MERRSFLCRTGVVSVASLAAYGPKDVSAQENLTVADRADRSGSMGDTIGTWHFHDRWRFDQFENLELKQGEATWQRDASYVEPNIGPLAAWPTVHHDAQSGRWRMWYSAAWKPLRLMVAESADGRDWSPLAKPMVQPVGPKIAPHHLFTLVDGSGGSVYLDPIADDGYPYKMFVHQRGQTVVERAKNDSSHRWHTVASDQGTTKYVVEDFTLVSRDGLHWEERRDWNWSSNDWHPEPPIFGFYNRGTKRHVMTVRPGWGDRRQCIQSTSDFRAWSGPELVLQPDAMDRELIEYYGMPVFPYGDGYVGLPWVFHSESNDPNRGFNRFVGGVDCRLAFSSDGKRFVAGYREPFIRRNAPDEHGAGAIQPSSMVETEKELLFYSAATRLPHGRGSEARKMNIEDNASILLHSLRKDGLMFVESRGDWGRFISKPLVLLDAAMSANAVATTGEVWVQLTDIESRPIEGFSFDDFVPMKFDDDVGFELSWKAGKTDDLLGKIIRIEVRMRNARLFALRSKLHFIDAQDRWLIEGGEPLPHLG